MSLQSLLQTSRAPESARWQWRGGSGISLDEGAGERADWHALLSHRGLMTLPAIRHVLAASIGVDRAG